jgi:DnaJ-class molecular chaperone
VLETETRQLYDRYGHAGLGAAAMRRAFRLLESADIFSAFFGDDLFARNRAVARVAMSSRRPAGLAVRTRA